eukprot:TRINITY_DN4860_c0_g3_i1.p1 TRINITY_DN4860_c0_g3~~TRINITY_DN4860_c0_g3_i1.p1  ORF type:complete len:159 (+),score=14.35 TRINITY_DN4860_c0_g3_i1:416-892(+)
MLKTREDDKVSVKNISTHKISSAEAKVDQIRDEIPEMTLLPQLPNPVFGVQPARIAEMNIGQNSIPELKKMEQSAGLVSCLSFPEQNLIDRLIRNNYNLDSQFQYGNPNSFTLPNPFRSNPPPRKLANWRPSQPLNYIGGIMNPTYQNFVSSNFIGFH